MKDSKLKHYAHSTAVLVYKCVKAVIMLVKVLQ